MKKNKLLLIISIFEILRWLIIYLFINFVKLNFDRSNVIQGETWFWFGSTAFISIIFAIGGVMIFFNPKKYQIIVRFWCAHKLFLVVFYIFLLFTNKTTIQSYFYLLLPVDFFIFLFALFNKVENNESSKNIEIEE